MGGIISIAVIIDFLKRLIRTENNNMPLIISAFVLFFSIALATKYINVEAALASFIGCFFTSLAVSKTLREEVIKSGKETQWTVGHIIGTGVVPFIAGIICFFSNAIKISKGSSLLLAHLDGDDKRCVPSSTSFSPFPLSLSALICYRNLQSVGLS